MAVRQSDFLRIRNHREVRSVLDRFSGGADLTWLEEAAAITCKQWFRLAQQHLQVARDLADSTRLWRATVSRCYYAVYNASKSVRYYVEGSVKLDARDHEKVGELPRDFPDREQWSGFAMELRRDRNLADYEPWSETRRSLTYDPQTALTKAEAFLVDCRDYLRRRGVPL